MSKSKGKGGRIQQPRIRGVVRIPSHSGFLPRLRAAVEREASDWGVTPSFVVATCVSFALNVEEQPDYRKDKQPKARVITHSRFLQRNVSKRKVG